MMISLSKSVCIALLILFQIGLIAGNGVIVSNAGTDAPGCGLPGTECQTIKYALSQLNAQNEFTMLLKGEVFTGPNNTDILIESSGIIIESENTNRATIDCEGASGPAFIMQDVYNVTLQFFDINRCASPESGGGLSVSNSNNCIFKTLNIFNSNSSKDGGGLFSFNSSNQYINLNVQNCTSFRDGGGVMLADSADVVTNAYIRYNKALSNGGGLAIEGKHPSGNNVTVNTAFIDWNNATFNGGGLYLSNVLVGQLAVANVTYNIAHNGGGAYLYNAGGINDCVFIGNIATLDGGGIYLNRSLEPSITHSLIEFNTAIAYGGGLYCDSSDFDGLLPANYLFENSAIVDPNSGLEANVFCTNCAACSSSCLVQNCTDCKGPCVTPAGAGDETCYFSDTADIPPCDCPFGCYGRGTCTKLGTCECKKGWAGLDCSIDRRSGGSSSKKKTNGGEIAAIVLLVLLIVGVLVGVGVWYMLRKKKEAASLGTYENL